MSALKIIRDIKAVGGNLRLIDGGLRVSAPPGRMTPGILAELKEHKQEILAALLTVGNKLPGVDQVQDVDSSKVSRQPGPHKSEDSPPDLWTPGNCLLCGLPLNQDGGDCWHRAFHLGDQSAKLRSLLLSPEMGRVLQ